MRRFFYCVAVAALAIQFIVPGVERSDAQGMQWGTIKGRLVWKKDLPIPAPAPIKINVNPEHCLKVNPTADAKAGTILDQNYIIDPKNRGLKNVFVYILLQEGQKIDIHPSLQAVKGDLVIDQPACMFFPRALVLRQGQDLLVKNSSPVQHNIRWIGDSINNQGGNQNLPPGSDIPIKGLVAQKLPLTIECNIHGWMKGRLAVVNHPYFAITDENGAFEIKDVPVGNHNFMIYHEEVGYRLGKDGKNGEAKTVKTGTNDWGDLEIGRK